MQKIKIIIPVASSVAVFAEMISRFGKKDFKRSFLKVHLYASKRRTVGLKFDFLHDKIMKPVCKSFRSSSGSSGSRGSSIRGEISNSECARKKNQHNKVTNNKFSPL